MIVNDFLHRIYQVLETKLAMFFGWMTAGALTVDGTVKKVTHTVQEQGLTLADWQIIVGIIFTITMIIPRLYAFYIWLEKKLKKEE
jgi:hypothetical protein